MKKLQRHPGRNSRLMKFYHKRAGDWGERYMKRHHWRIRSMYDKEDIEQDAFGLYLRVYRKHTELKEPDLLKIYKVAMRFRINTRSKQCFPNSFAYKKDQGAVAIPIEEEWLEEEATVSIEDTFTEWSDIMSQLPDDLTEVFKLLVKDFYGVFCINQYKGKRLGSKGRIEPFNRAVARELNLDPSRDLIGELTEAIRTRV